MNNTPVLFKDLGKRISDLFTKEFPLNEKKLEWKGEVDGVTIETNFSQKGDNIVGTFTPKYKYGKYGLNFLGEFTTKRDGKIEVSAEEITPGVKAIVTAQYKSDELFGILATEYKHQYATVTAAAEVGRPKGTIARCSVVVSPGLKNVSFGASSEYFIGSNEASDLRELNTAVSYSAKDFEANVFGRIKNSEDKHEVGANFFHQVNKMAGVAGEIVFDAQHTDKSPKFTVGTHYKWSSETTLKSKMDSTGQLGFSYQQLFPNQTKLTIASSIDVKNPSEKTSKFGVGLALNF